MPVGSVRFTSDKHLNALNSVARQNPLNSIEISFRVTQSSISDIFGMHYLNVSKFDDVTE